MTDYKVLCARLCGAIAATDNKPRALDDAYSEAVAVLARWGADQELEACCALMDDWGLDEADLRAARRPEPPSLKQQALAALKREEEQWPMRSAYRADGFDTIRRALEALPE